MARRAIMLSMSVMVIHAVHMMTMKSIVRKVYYTTLIESQKGKLGISRRLAVVHSSFGMDF